MLKLIKTEGKFTRVGVELFRAKILGGCKERITYTTRTERGGSKNLKKIHVYVFPCIWGRDI